MANSRLKASREHAGNSVPADGQLTAKSGWLTGWMGGMDRRETRARRDHPQRQLAQILAQSGLACQVRDGVLARQMQVEHQACSTAQRALVELRKRTAAPDIMQKLANRVREHQVAHVLLAKARNANARRQDEIKTTVAQGNLPEAQRLHRQLQQQLARQQADLLQASGR